MSTVMKIVEFRIKNTKEHAERIAVDKERVARIEAVKKTIRA